MKELHFAVLLEQNWAFCSSFGAHLWENSQVFCDHFIIWKSGEVDQYIIPKAVSGYAVKRLE